MSYITIFSVCTTCIIVGYVAGVFIEKIIATRNNDENNSDIDWEQKEINDREREFALEERKVKALEGICRAMEVGYNVII